MCLGRPLRVRSIGQDLVPGIAGCGDSVGHYDGNPPAVGVDLDPLRRAASARLDAFDDSLDVAVSELVNNVRHAKSSIYFDPSRAEGFRTGGELYVLTSFGCGQTRRPWPLAGK